MDDAKDPGTVTANTCPWEHEAVVRRRKLLLYKRWGLAAIGEAALLQGGFDTRHAPPTGTALSIDSVVRAVVRTTGVVVRIHALPLLSSARSSTVV